MILMIDNFDSFAHNLARYLRQLGCEVCVVRNESLDLELLEDKTPHAIVMSPGPCRPENAGICLDLVERFRQRVPMLGVCLGHQVLCQSFGAEIVRSAPVHGQSSQVFHNGHPLFDGIESPFTAARYHSLSAQSDTIVHPLEILARTRSGTVMAVAHKEFPLFGVQFHPESLLTTRGYRIVANFLQLSGMAVDAARVDQLDAQLMSERSWGQDSDTADPVF